MKQSEADFEVKISKEELSTLPIEKFSGEIVVIDRLEDIDNILPELEEAPVVGFDTETKPAFQKGQVNRVALLQLATGSRCFLIRISKIGLPDKIKEFLENPSHLKIGLSVKDDFHSLSKLGPFKPAGFIDLQDYVKQFLISDCSLTKVHAIIFGKRISKGQQLTNWESANLSSKQQQYAALDAVACINIYNNLKSGAFQPSDSPYKKTKCQEEK